MLNKIILAGGVAFGTVVLAALGVDIYEHRRIEKKIGKSIDDMSKATAEDISASMMEKAVDKAAQRQVSTLMDSIKHDVMATARITLGDEARKAVKEASEQIRREVSERISTEASLIDMTALKKSARDKAEAKILEKFDGNLEDLLEKFNDNLSNVQKIYGGIADAITKTKEQSNGIKFTIG